MIRINLIGTKTRAKPKVNRSQLLVYAALILLEAGVLFVWQQKLSSELVDATRRTKEATQKIDDLKKVKLAWEQWQAEKADLDRQTQIFMSLRADQVGPPLMLQYLSYALTHMPDTPAVQDEAKAQELVGWDPKWDTRRVWIKDLKERDGMLTIDGEAIDHEDVAEFYRRMEASGFFLSVEPGLQARKMNGDLGVKFIEFTVTSGLSYRAALAEPPKVEAAPQAATGPGAAVGPGQPAGPGR